MPEFITTSTLLFLFFVCSVTWVNSWKRYYQYRKQGSPRTQDRVIKLYIKTRQVAIIGMAVTSGIMLIVYERYYAVTVCFLIGAVVGFYWHRISSTIERYN